MVRQAFVIAQLSDLHCGSPYFDAALLETAVKETIGIRPDLVLVGGDLTAEGYAHEFREAQAFLEPLFAAGLETLVIPGNHDAKNVGYLHFRDAFGPGDVPAKHDRALSLTSSLRAVEDDPDAETSAIAAAAATDVRAADVRAADHADGPDGGDRSSGSGGPMRVRVVAIDSTKPDLAEGEIGRERYSWIRERFAGTSDVRVFALHHHLVPVPGTGRERNTVWDSGDVLALIDELDVHLALSGHKHVPNVWLLNGVLLVNSGTVSSYRVRGYTRPSYNLIEVTADRIRVTLRYPGSGEQFAAELDRRTLMLTKSRALNAMFDKDAWSL